VLGLPMGMLGHNLGSFLLYLWSKYFEGMDVNFMDILILKSEFLPYFFCLQSLLLERQFPYGDLIGILVGYFYYLLKERGYLQSPTFLKAFFAKNRFFSQRYAKLKDDFEL
jgi:Derlin-2/3